MTIQKRLKRANLIMLIVPAAIAGVLLAAGIGVFVWLMQTRIPKQMKAINTGREPIRFLPVLFYTCLPRGTCRSPCGTAPS